MENKNLIVPRVGVVIIENDALLLTYSKYGDQEFWLLPGGGIEFEETIPECGRREVLEETGLNIVITKFLYLREFIPKNKKDHVIDIFFLGEKIGGELKKGNDPDNKEQVIKKVEFVPLSKLRDIKIYPECLPELILNGINDNFKDCPKYIGRC